MKDLLTLVFEYRRLVARRDVMRAPLSRRARDRLAALERLFSTDDVGDESAREGARRAWARCDVDVRATLRVDGRMEPINIVNVGGGGVCVTPAPAIRPGQQAVIRIVADGDGRIYQYQVEAVWVVDDGERSAAGMPFVGIPRELPLTS